MTAQQSAKGGFDGGRKFLSKSPVWPQSKAVGASGTWAEKGIEMRLWQDLQLKFVMVMEEHLHSERTVFFGHPGMLLPCEST